MRFGRWLARAVLTRDRGREKALREIMASKPMILEPSPPLRGRVHRVSIVAGGEVSVVLRFGGEEVAARALNQGTLVELREAPAPVSEPLEESE